MNFFVFPKAGRSIHGVVADRCQLCMEVSKGDLVGLRNFYHVGVAWLPGPIVATVFDCEHCGGNYGVKPARFDEVIPAKAAKTLPLPEVLKRTNRRLFAELITERKLRAAVESWNGQGRDPRQDLARFTLSGLSDHDAGVAELNALVERWPALGEPERRHLLSRIDRKYQKVVYECRVDGVARRTAHAFVVWHVFVAPFVGLAVVFAGFGITLLAPEGWHGLGFFLSFIAGLLAPIAAYLPLKRLNYRLLFRTVLLPDAKKWNVDLEDVIAWMKHVRKAYRQRKLGRSQEAKRWYALSTQLNLLRSIADHESLRPSPPSKTQRT